MPISSMTGFASQDGSIGALQWRWDIRSVNGKGLDIRLRLPPGMEALEQQIRDCCKSRLARGNVAVSLNMQRENGAGTVRLNEAVLLQVAEAVRRAGELTGAAPPTIDGLLSIRGVLESGETEEDAEAQEARNKSMLEDLAVALGNLGQMRLAEGGRLETVLRSQISEIEALVARIEASPARTPKAIEARLKELLQRLRQDKALDADRLHQEAVLLATKADIQEEIERLRAHVAAALDLLDSKEPVGRRFEFLTQEFNREANTICSKSNDVELTRAGLALKAVIDQMREQVQNIE
ncbi:MAG: YicC/YloC family endoribonuclease [Pseudomonadota bacterium]|nr:YicC/YloC family endoribonuclease [Pseudomonadota bacterium]